eukprot:jgi/Tetstr1/456666/TSEL_043367.t1
MAPIISPSASPNSTPTASANLSTLMTKDRETRLVGCSKAFKPKSVFPSVHPFQKPYNAHPDEIITCLDKGTRRQARLPSSRAARVPPQSRDGLSFKATRLLEMVQQDPHPSAYFRDSGTDNSRSRTYFRFDYTDRSELCYTGDTHSAQNCKCFVMPDGEAFMQCFSRRRRKTHPRALNAHEALARGSKESNTP